MKNDKEKSLRTMKQQCCNIRDYHRMSTNAGKASAKEAESLAEDMLRLITKREPGVHSAVVAATAVAMVRAYVRKGLCWGVDPEAVTDMEKMEQLFGCDFWMLLHNDMVALDMEHFFRNEPQCMACL